MGIIATPCSMALIITLEKKKKKERKRQLYEATSRLNSLALSYRLPKFLHSLFQFVKPGIIPSAILEGIDDLIR
jgi:hypothetical protein